MKLAVLKETFPGERRVSLVPSAIKSLEKIGHQVVVEAGAGSLAGFSDEAYQQANAQIAEERGTCLAADVLIGIRVLGADKDHADDQLGSWTSGQVVVATCDPLGEPDYVRRAAEVGISLLALELIPRITRAQSMDVLSSMACVAGYRAVILAAAELRKMFPLMMTAAGTLSPARVFVIGAGVAGLQAIATARRLGAVVQAYDVRPAVREQVESLGAKFVALQLDSAASEDQGGYAKAMGEEFYQRQRELMASVLSESDIVITTAAIPGRPSPLLITEEAVKGMPDGGVIIDLAAERGGNCALTQADQRTLAHGITILGPTNLPSEVAYHASQMFSKNVTTLLQHLTTESTLRFDRSDEVTAGTLAAHDQTVTQARLREILEMDPLPAAESNPTEATS